MSPEEIRHGKIRQTPIGRRGYRPEDVDLLLGRVAREVERWAEAYAESEAEVCRLRDYYRSQGVDVDHQQSAETVSLEALRILVRAQAYADRVIAEAKIEARRVQSDMEARVAEAERLVAWTRGLLGSIQAAQTQLAATGETFTRELARFTPPRPAA
jgi:DivIVA domain-containing protein